MSAEIKTFPATARATVRPRYPHPTEGGTFIGATMLRGTYYDWWFHQAVGTVEARIIARNGPDFADVWEMPVSLVSSLAELPHTLHVAGEPPYAAFSGMGILAKEMLRRYHIGQTYGS